LVNRAPDAEVVGVGEGLAEETGPLLADLADLGFAVGRQNLEEQLNSY
jgi:hypothetical protein